MCIRDSFSPEAPLSQVKRQLLPDETLWYSRTIQLPENCLDTESQRLLPVSYTHLDVYKRQGRADCGNDFSNMLQASPLIVYKYMLNVNIRAVSYTHL